MENFTEKLDPKSVFLVTGGAGFIGSNLVEHLLEMGYTVRCMDDLSNGKLDNIQDFMSNPQFTFIRGDIRDLSVCEDACGGSDYVLHQAAIGSVPRSIRYPLLYEAVNIGGTLNMMEAARRKNVKKFVYASSSSVYGDSSAFLKREGEEGETLSPYALTKKTNEEFGRLYKELYGLNTYGLRYFNVFGKRQNPNSAYAAVIPKFIRLLLNGESPTIYGDGTISRDFTYIENVVQANLHACVAPDQMAGEAYNVACGDSWTLNELYDLLCEQLGSHIPAKYGPPRQGDIQHSRADITKTKKCLGYTPEYTFQNGLKKTVRWYRENLI